jgi:hypothetical protein
MYPTGYSKAPVLKGHSFNKTKGRRAAVGPRSVEVD